MPITAGKIRVALLASFIGHVLIAVPPGHAQTPAEPAAAAPTEPAAPPPAPPSPPKNPLSGEPAESPPPAPNAALDYLYNRKPQDGSAAKQASEVSRRLDDKAKAAEALGLGKAQLRVDQERFEKYLGTSEVTAADLQAYAVIINQVAGLLREEKTFEAWRLLRQAAVYQPIDAGVSLELANRVEAVWNTSRATVRTDTNNDKLRQQIKSANQNADFMSKAVREEEMRLKRKETEGRKPAASKANNGGVPSANADAGGGAASSVSGLEGKLQLTEQYLQTLEAKAKIKMNELKLEKLLDSSKTDFAAYIGTLASNHRQLHVIVAAEFYRRIFNEGSYPVAMANQVNAALEMQRSVAAAVEVFRYKVQRNEIAAATDRLREAFAMSEYHAAVLGLAREQKEKVAQFTADLGKMQNFIEARDFTSLEALLHETKSRVSDFDTAKALALVNAVKLESKLRMGKAKLAAQAGNLKVAMEEFQAAAETWPGNPDLQDKANAFFETQDVKSQSLTEFDRLFSDGNFRGIFDKQLAFAPAMKDDLKRQEQLKTALEKIKLAEFAAEKASAMMMGGDPFGAWETIEAASKDLPDDRKLNKLRADLSGKSPEFVSAVNKARDAEARSDFGFSLTWYVNAQRQYPASRIANEAIERLSKQLLGGRAASL